MLFRMTNRGAQPFAIELKLKLKKRVTTGLKPRKGLQRFLRCTAPLGHKRLNPPARHRLVQTKQNKLSTIVNQLGVTSASDVSA